MCLLNISVRFICFLFPSHIEKLYKLYAYGSIAFCFFLLFVCLGFKFWFRFVLYDFAFALFFVFVCWLFVLSLIICFIILLYVFDCFLLVCVCVCVCVCVASWITWDHFSWIFDPIINKEILQYINCFGNVDMWC